MDRPADLERAEGPFVMRVDLVDEGGTAHTVFSGGDATTYVGGALVIPVPLTSYRVARARVVTEKAASSQVMPGIDAVGVDVVRTERYAYNGFNQLLTVTGADGGQTAFGYDGNGNQTSKTVRSGWVTQRTTYGYDADNRLRTVTVPSGPGAEASSQWGTSATASDAWAQTGSWAPSQAAGAP